MPTPEEWLPAAGQHYKTRNGERVELHITAAADFAMYGIPVPTEPKKDDGHREPFIRYTYDTNGTCIGVIVDQTKQPADRAHDLMHCEKIK